MATATAQRPKANGKPKTQDMWGGTINVPAKCKVSKVASTDKTRPILCHAHITEHDGKMWLCATDSYRAVAVMVDGSGLREGFIPIGALRLIEQGRQCEQLGRYSWRVETPDGSVTFDVESTLKSSKDFPDLAKVGIFDKYEAGEWTFQKGKPINVGFNPEFMASMSAALGAKFGVRLEMVGPLKPTRVFALGNEARGIGLLMPIRLNV